MPFLFAGGSRLLASRRLAIERDVYRARIDSAYTQPMDSGSVVLKDVMLYDHFVPLQHVVGDTTMWSSTNEWLRDSFPQLSADARTDFRVRTADTSSIMAAMIASGAAAGTEPGLPFPHTRAHIQLLDDSTLAQFFSLSHRHASGWTEFRAAYPNGTGIVSLSRIGLSRDRLWAIAYVGQSWHWGDVVGRVYVLHRRGGEWRIVKSRVLWTS
jgi:hypothetical protein